MTAQIVILNKVAIAVASDSSVTFSRQNEVRRSFPTAEKIFPLPPPHQLAVLHSGDTELLGVPYAVLLGEWSRTLDEHRLDRVSDYPVSFCAWVEAQTDLFTEEMQDNYLDWILRDYFLAVRGDLLQECKDKGLGEDEWQTPAAAALVDGVTTARLDRLRRLPTHPSFVDIDAVGYLSAHAKILDEVREWVFDDTPRTLFGDENLKEMACQLVSADEPYSRDAHLVFAGFGRKEIFPASQMVSYRGVLAGKVRTSTAEYVAISSDNGATISPYAHSEAVTTFLRGYNSSFLDAAHKRIDVVLEDFGDEGDPGPNHDQDAWSKVHAALSEDFETLSWTTFVEPLVNTVAGLPAAELARIAEALVGLQVLRQLTQAETETVGGPVDVALITRDRGVTWVRHKSTGPTQAPS